MSAHPDPSNKKSDAMSRARAGAGKSTRNAAALETRRPRQRSYTLARRFPTDHSTPRKLNLRKLARGDGINCGGLQYEEHRSPRTHNPHPCTQRRTESFASTLHHHEDIPALRQVFGAIQR